MNEFQKQFQELWCELAHDVCMLNKVNEIEVRADRFGELNWSDYLEVVDYLEHRSIEMCRAFDNALVAAAKKHGNKLNIEGGLA